MGRFLTFVVSGAFLLLGCREKSQEFFLDKSLDIQRELAQEFSSVQTLQDLLAREEIFTHLFTDLSSTAIQADRWKKNHPTRKKAFLPSESDVAIALEQEFRRVLSIPGAEACIEKFQKKAVDRLDLYLHQQKVK